MWCHQVGHRWELSGSRRIDSPWAAIDARILERLWAALQAEQPVVLNATSTRRQCRLAITQALNLLLPVQWNRERQSLKRCFKSGDPWVPATPIPRSWICRPG